MASQNYVLLERIELNASAASVTFSNIPQTGYTDLKLVVSARTTYGSASGDFFKVTFNGNTSSYSARLLIGNGSTASSISLTNQWAMQTGSNGQTANTFGNGEIYIPNYTSANNKSFSSDSVSETNATTTEMELAAGLWSNTAAITSISLASGNSGSILANSTFSLYGIANSNTTPVVAPKASGGNVIATDGTYWWHIFNTNGTFTPQVGLSCEYLVIAGGGGGGGRYGSGAGAGGYLTGTNMSVTSGTGYAVTVGAGGPGAVANIGGANGIKGIDSTFNSVTAIGGGYGVTRGGAAVSSGGSGAGAAWRSATAGTATSGQGNAGGTARSTSTDEAQAGGGGAGAAGNMPAVLSGSQNGGAGGAGLASSITGSSVTRAGGGGGGGYDNSSGASGGAGGAGGGGAGGVLEVAGTAGTANTGGGGGGAGNSSAAGTGGNGGSGIVIVRYLVA